MYTPISGKAHDAPTESEARSMIREAIDTVDETLESKKRQKTHRKRVSLPPLSDAEADTKTLGENQKTIPTHVKAASKRLGFGFARIRRKHFWWAAAIGLAYWNPILLAVVVGATLFCVVLAFLLIGAERIWKGVILAIREIETRNPHKAHRMRQKIQAFSARWDRALDRCPDGWVDGFYMPDLKALETQDLDHATTVAERLRRLPDQAGL